MKNIKENIFKILGILLIVGGLFLTNAFLGNPVSKNLAKRGSQKYIKENYNHLNLEKVKTFYSFKDGYYHVFVQSKDSIDTNFDIRMDSFGNVIADDYSSIGFNTWRRLDLETGEKLSPIFRSGLNYDIENIRVGLSRSNMDEDLEMDMELDIYKPPLAYEIHVGIYTDDLTYEKLAEVAMDIGEIMNKEKFPIEYMSFVLIPLSNKVKEGRAVSWSNALTAFDIPVEILKADDIPNRIREYNKAQYQEIDKKK